MADYRHQWFHLILIYVTMVILGITILLATTAAANDLLGIYNSSIAYVSDTYDTHLTPEDWTFQIWSVIFIWQILWLLYAASQTCRMGVDGYLYYSPPLLPWYFYIVYLINQIAVIAWLFLFDREELILALVALILTALTVYACLFISVFSYEREGVVLLQNGFRHEPGMVVGFVHNGLGVYGTWVTIASLLNLIMVMHYVGGANMEDATSVGLTILIMLYVIWLLTDNIFLDRYTRWTVTPYLVIVWAMTGAVVKNFERAGARNSLFLAVILAVAIVGLLCKFIFATVRECRRKPYQDDSASLQTKSVVPGNAEPFPRDRMYRGTNGQFYKY